MNTLFKIGSSKEVLEASSKVSHFFGNAFLPQKAYVPIGYKGGKDVFFNVYKASRVREGQLIGRGDDSSSFAYIHSPIPGVVTDFKDFNLRSDKILKTIEISLDGSFDILGKEEVYNDWHAFSKEELLSKLEKSGVIDTSSRIIMPLHVTLNDAIEKKRDTVSTTLFDFYPSQSLDIFLGEKEVRKVIEGALILARTLDAKKIIVFHNITNKKLLLQYIASIESLCGDVKCEMKKIKKVYPLHLQLGSSFFVNATTSLYAYEAITYSRPLTSIYLSIRGKLIAEPKILRVRVGTPIKNILQECNTLKKHVEGFIINGITSGYAIKDADIPITKEMKSIHVVSKEMLNFYDEMDCINCGKCFTACPCNIDPIGIVRAIKKGAVSDSVSLSVKACEGCACCSIVCPARINLAKAILSYKDEHQLYKDC